VSIKVTVHRSFKIKVNGVEYESIDQLPPELRDAYEKAVQAPPGLTVNGKPTSLEALPPDVRGIVSEALGAAAKKRDVSTWAFVLLCIVLALITFYVLPRLR
jgi:hypothetical protein